uniref:Cadherin N-terminal domain-containing protein n=1 Tax=Anabas testudineus TaxID=64144 RepID=A0AAQ6IVM0_ANATE
LKIFPPHNSNVCNLRFNSIDRHISYSVSEEVDKGTVVGNLAKDLNVNIRDLQTRNLNIVSGYSKKYFGANFKTGDLYVNERIDREECTEQWRTQCIC